MNFEGIIVGVGAFLIIGILHPVVIKAEYYWSKGIWPLFLVGGLGCIVLSLVIEVFVLSGLCAVLGFSLLWSIRELFEQEQRVREGRYPANPKRAQKGNLLSAQEGTDEA